MPACEPNYQICVLLKTIICFLLNRKTLLQNLCSLREIIVYRIHVNVLHQLHITALSTFFVVAA